MFFGSANMMCQRQDEAVETDLVQPRRGRRGTTAMEYLMMLSLIIVVALVGVGYFGTTTNNVMQSTSSAITKSIKKGG